MTDNFAGIKKLQGCASTILATPKYEHARVINMPIFGGAADCNNSKCEGISNPMACKDNARSLMLMHDEGHSLTIIQCMKREGFVGCKRKAGGEASFKPLPDAEAARQSMEAFVKKAKQGFTKG